MKCAQTIVVWVLVILIAGIFGYQAFISSTTKGADIAPSADQAQIIAKAGMNYLMDLRGEGRLPGVTTNDHGNASISGRLAGYPYSLATQFKTGEVFTDHYTVEQIRTDAPWQLTRAWQTDSNGQIVQEWSLK